VSLDGGLTWQETSEVDNIEIKNLPILHCGRLNPEICYRITSYGNIKELGSDGEWGNVEELIVEEGTMEGYDMIIFEWEEKEIVIIAAGDYGVLRRELPDGKWQLIPVHWAVKSIATLTP
jgi:hypothetical protein